LHVDKKKITCWHSAPGCAEWDERTGAAQPATLRAPSPVAPGLCAAQILNSTHTLDARTPGVLMRRSKNSRWYDSLSIALRSLKWSASRVTHTE
jgi:hypothetical protein